MGYRNYLYIADKKIVNKVRKMTKAELWEFSKRKPFEDEELPYWDGILEEVGAEEAFEMGKYIDYHNRLKPFLKPFSATKKFTRTTTRIVSFLLQNQIFCKP